MDSQTLIYNNIFKKNNRSYLKLIDDNLFTFKEQYDAYLKDLQDKPTGEFDLEFSSHLNNIHWLFLNSIFVTLYSSFEMQLFKVARAIDQMPENAVKIDDIYGEGVFKYSKYLYKVGKIQSADQSRATWSTIQNFRKTRNFLVHNGGLMQYTMEKDITEHKQYNFLKSHDVIMAGSLGMIRIRNPKLLVKFIEVVEKIADEIVSEYYHLYPKPPK